jgi:hypothetical protein
LVFWPYGALAKRRVPGIGKKTADNLSLEGYQDLKKLEKDIVQRGQLEKIVPWLMMSWTNWPRSADKVLSSMLWLP